MAKKKAARARRRAPTKARTHAATPGLYGWITHTDIGSHEPDATKAWCEKVLGWTFRPAMQTPAGDYHLFVYSEKGGGGIRQVKSSEIPDTIPYVHVADCSGAFEHALREGAEQVSAPMRITENVTIAVVRAPGGVTIGFSGP